MTDADKVALAAKLLRTAFETDAEMAVAYMDAVFTVLTYEEDEDE